MANAKKNDPDLVQSEKDFFQQGELWLAVESDDPETAKSARDSIILRYQFLVEAAARKLKGTLPSWIEEGDLMSYGQIGLIKAVDTFEPAKGSFRSFAYMKIFGAIMDELRTQDWAPRGLRREQRLINSARKELQLENPSSDVLGQALNWEVSKVTATLKKIENSQHVNIVHAYDSLSSEEKDLPEAVSHTGMLCQVFVDELRSLPPETQLIVARRYFLGQSLPVVAREVGTPLAQVRKLHTEAIVQIQRAVKKAVSL